MSVRLAVLLLSCALVAGCSAPAAVPADSAPPETFSAPVVVQQPIPVRVEIPAVQVAGELIGLGLDPDGTTAEPPVGNPKLGSWYNLGPRPGAIGPAVLLGHVDGGGEPGIFANLKNTKVGDVIHVVREDMSVVKFRIYRTQQIDKDEFPTNDVYDDTILPEIRLVTCGGAFQVNEDSYQDSVIRYGRLVQS